MQQPLIKNKLYSNSTQNQTNLNSTQDQLNQNQSQNQIHAPFHQNQLNQNQLFQNQINPFEPPTYNVPVQKDIRASFAAETNQLREQGQSYHIKALFASLIMWGAIPTLIVLYLVNNIDLTPGALVGICGGIYFFYLILSMCCNPLFNYLSNVQHGSKFSQEYDRVKGLNGHFVFNVVCYHYQTRHHTRTVSDGNGGTKTEHYTTTEKVVTYRNSENINPIYTRDDSGNIDSVRALTLIIFVHYLVNYRFVDDRSRIIFDRLWYSFKCRNRFDVHQDYTYQYIVPGLIDRMTFFIGQKKPNWKSKLIIYSLLGLIWPYSMWIQGKISRYNISFMKILTMGDK